MKKLRTYIKGTIAAAFFAAIGLAPGLAFAISPSSNVISPTGVNVQGNG